jgi:hypothetical protein
MTALVVGIILLVLSSIVLFFTGWLTIGINSIFYLAYDYHKKLRRDQRPSRIFLIRHGESQANVDKSKYSLIISSILYLIFLEFSFIRTYGR